MWRSGRREIRQDDALRSGSLSIRRCRRRSGRDRLSRCPRERWRARLGHPSQYQTAVHWEVAERPRPAPPRVEAAVVVAELDGGSVRTTAARVSLTIDRAAALPRD